MTAIIKGRKRTRKYRCQECHNYMTLETPEEYPETVGCNKCGGWDIEQRDIIPKEISLLFDRLEHSVLMPMTHENRQSIFSQVKEITKRLETHMK